ncbi:hypothetical protein JHK87_043322 [Glycine soja]|nr:hypothetical protein JHK87_043322 [Glycine soja]
MGQEIVHQESINDPGRRSRLSKLEEVHEVLKFNRLTHSDVHGCREIESLNVHSKSLQILYLSGCTSLKEFSVTSEEMTRLD